MSKRIVQRRLYFAMIGARAHKASVLEKLQELMRSQDQLQEKEKLLQNSKKQLATLKRKADE